MVDPVLLCALSSRVLLISVSYAFVHGQLFGPCNHLVLAPVRSRVVRHFGFQISISILLSVRLC